MSEMKTDYVIVTDSGCDMTDDILADWGVPCVQLWLTYNGDIQARTNQEVEPREFYNMMREGGGAKTSAANPEDFRVVFEQILLQGKDILYIGFSSGLSTTVNSGRIAAEKLMEKYPERKIITVDSLCASAGQGLLVYLAVLKKRSGASLDENAAYVRENVLNVCHWFTVDDLEYLKRGGRISPAVAFVGGLLGIKPVLHVDNEGHLVNVTKVRGRRASIKALADKLGETAIDKTVGPVFICQGDCADDAALLADFVKNDYGLDIDITVFTGPVIGSHSGPGTLALFFLGKER